MKFARKVRYVRAIVVSGVLAAFVPSVVEAAENQKNQLIERGRELFTNETFDGNGRTCATCHPATNNFTLDPAFIAKLPKTDPLFVAETNPDLAKLENSKALRERALVSENVDGFDRPAVLRGVPHTLALPVSIAPDDDDRFGPGLPRREQARACLGLDCRRLARGRFAASVCGRRRRAASDQDLEPSGGCGFPPADQGRARRA